MGRLNRDVETTLFRILQEGLTNVHRHSGGSRVTIRLEVDAEQVHLKSVTIARNSRTALRRMREDGLATGVGLAGMSEQVARIRRLVLR